MDHTEERHESLWWLAAAPAVWLGHFVVTYATVAVTCERTGDLATARSMVLSYTAVLGTAAAAIATRGLLRHRARPRTEHHRDTRVARSRFLGFSTFVLGALAAVGIAFVSVPIALWETCR